MTDIETAIEITQRQIEELKSNLPTLVTQEYYDSFNLAIEVKKLSVEALTEQLNRLENPPLTVEELKKMEGEPIFIKRIEEIIGNWDVLTGIECRWSNWWLARMKDGTLYWLENYGKTWLAYRHKPADKI